MRLLLLASAFSTCLATGPRPSNCQPGEQRCTVEMVEVCSPSHRWRTAQNCSLVEPGTWECHADGGAARCEQLQVPQDAAP
jgi:hypothetical protein